jgi:hypothetical protein
MNLLRLLAVLVAALPALASAAEELPIPEGLPAEVKKLFERELAKKLEPRTWALGERLNGKVEAAEPPTVTVGEELDEVGIAIGTETPISCTVARKRLDAAGWVAGVVNEAAKNVQLAGVRPVDLTVVAGSPLLFVDALYVKDSPGGKLIGLLKAAVYSSDSRMFLCIHDEPGYRQSFRRIVAGFAQAMEGGEDEQDDARFVEVASAYIGKIPVGFSEEVLWDRKGGGTISRSRMSMLLARTPTDLMPMDAYEEEEADAKDLILSGLYVEAMGGELSHTVTLTRAADGKKFTVEGTVAGKALKGSFTVKSGLASDLWFTRRLAASAKPAAVLSHETYSAGDDPLKTRVQTAKPIKGPVRKAEFSNEKVKYVAELDDDGLQTAAEMPLGPITLTVKRVWSRGKP